MATPTRDPSAPWHFVADEAHKRLILQSFPTFGSLSEAMAQHLGIGRTTLHREVRRLGLRGALEALGAARQDGSDCASEQKR